MRTLQVLCLGLAAFTCLAGARAGQTYVDPKFGFQITFPDGWQIGLPKTDGGVVGGLLATPRTVCVALAEEDPNTKSNTQSQLDAEMGEPFGLEFWQNREDSTSSNVVVKSHGGRLHPSGRIVQEAVLEEPSESGPGTSIVTIFSTPGVVHVVLCETGTNSFAVMQPIMTTVIDSYRPRAGGMVAVVDSIAPPGVALRKVAAGTVPKARAEAVKLSGK